jgi:hypothetical protein
MLIRDVGFGRRSFNIFQIAPVLSGAMSACETPPLVQSTASLVQSHNSSNLCQICRGLCVCKHLAQHLTGEQAALNMCAASRITSARRGSNQQNFVVA